MDFDRRIFFDHHPDAMWICDLATQRFLDVNHAAVIKYGYSRECFLSMTLSQIEAEDGLPFAVRDLQSNTGPVESGIRRHRLQSGGLIHVDLTAHQFELDGAKVKLVVVRDVTRITEAARRDRDLAQASAQQFKAMFEAVPGRFLVMTASPHRIVAVSDSHLQMTGFARDFLVGKLLFDAFPIDPANPDADGQSNLRASLQRVEASGVTDVMPLLRYAVGPRDGSAGPFEERYWSVVNAPMLGPDGAVEYIINRVEEVTDLVRDGADPLSNRLPSGQITSPALRVGIELMIRAEELQVANTRLQESTLNLRAAQRLMQVGTFHINVALETLTWSDELAEMCGVEKLPAGSSLATYLKMIHPDDFAQFVADFDAFVASGRMKTDFAHRILRRSGEIVHLKGIMENRDTVEGRTIFGVVRDVTAERNAEQRLWQVTLLARLAGRIAKLGAWRLDYDPLRVTWSDETAAIHGEPPGFTPNLEDALAYYPPGPRAQIIAAVEECHANGTPFDEVMQLVTAQGNPIWVRSIGEPEHDENGRVIAIRGAFQDITELVETRSEADKLALRLAQTLENLNEAFLTVDRDFRFTFINHKAEEILGMPRESLLHLPLTGPAQDGGGDGIGADLLEAFRRAIETQESVRIPQYFSRARNIWLEINAHPTPEGLAVYFRDISQERAKTDQLRLLEKSVSHLNDMVMITEARTGDGSGLPTVVYVNDAFVDFSGLTRKQILAAPAAPAAAGGATSELDRLRTVLLSTPTVMSDPIRFSRDGRDHWIECSVNPVVDDEGVTTHVVSVLRDITERKQTEQALRLSEERFRLVSNSSSAVVWDVDLVTNDVWFNINLATVFGSAPDSATPDLQVWRKHIHPDDIERYLEKLSSALAGDALTWQDEFRIVRQDGTVVDLSDRAHIIRDESGKAVRMLGSFTDVTSENLDAARRRQSQKLEAMGQLTGGVAHDFNNLLTVMMGNAEMIAETVADPKIRQMAEFVVNAADRGAALTGRLLAFARKQPLEPSPMDMTAHVAAMGGMLRRTLPEDIEIDYMPSDGLWKVDVDANQLQVALLNLVLNARDAMPDGGKLTIETCNARLDHDSGGALSEFLPGDYVLLTVTDTGTGMAPDVLERAFEPFFTTKNEGLGSGLGLSLVYGFVKQSGGQIKTYSELGVGTSFKLYFPRSLSTDAEDRKDFGEAAIVGGTEHILVVEDDDHVRDHLVRQLKGLGYQVTYATNGQEAYDHLATMVDVDLVLTDVIMPGGMNGRQLADAARVLRPDLRVLYTSGYTENAIVHHGRLDKGVDLLSKPYRRQELAAKVRKVLDANRTV